MQKPWNIPNLPVYSLATYNNESLNMNICTYVSAVSMKPKRYMVAVYENTQTLKNITGSKIVVLQLLHETQFNLVKKLGLTSGMLYNKENYLQKKKLLTTWENHKVLQNTAALLLLKKLWIKNAGDHHLVLFDVLKSKAFSKDYLMLNELRNRKIIRG